MKESKLKYLLVALAAVIHLLPLPFGVSPVGATALYAGATGPRRGYWAVPLLLLLVGNTVFGFYEPLVMGFVYLGFALSAVVARCLLASRRTNARLSVAVVSGALVFFVVSNFSVWLAGMYPPTVAGLLACYLNGLPYLGLAVVVDGLFALAIFAMHDLLLRRYTGRRSQVLTA